MSKSLTSVGGLLAAFLLTAGSGTKGESTLAEPPAQQETGPAVVGTDIQPVQQTLQPVQQTLAATVKTGPIFNSPVGATSSQHAISSHVSKLIAGAPKGAVIYVAMYHFSTQDMATQLVKAKKRKVNVRVVLDHESVRYKAYQTPAQRRRLPPCRRRGKVQTGLLPLGGG